jgi:hypothetical protein
MSIRMSVCNISIQSQRQSQGIPMNNHASSTNAYHIKYAYGVRQQNTRAELRVEVTAEG